MFLENTSKINKIKKLSVSKFMGILKGKSSLMIFDQFAHLKYKYGNRHFWCRGYYVDTVTYFYGHYVKMQSVTERKKESRGVDFLVYRGSLRVFMITFVRF